MQTMDNLVPNGRLVNHKLIRIVHSGSKTISHLAKDEGGQRFLITAVDKERVTKKLQYKAFISGDGNKDYDEVVKEAARLLTIVEEKLKDVAQRTRGLGDEHVAMVYGTGYDQSRECLVIVSEYVPGTDIFFATNRLSPLQTISLFVQTLEGLKFVHNCGFLHLNIKASRIRVDLEGDPPVVKLMDFGFAIPMGKYDGEQYGTSIYMAPEIILSQKENVTERADLYSLGILMYYCLTGKFPTEHRLQAGSDKKELARCIDHENIFTPPKHINEEIPDELNDIIMALIEKKIEDRLYYNTKDLLNAFYEKWPKESTEMPHKDTSTLYNDE